MYVCLSVMGLRLKYMGLCIVYVLLRMPSCDGMEIEVDGRWLTAQQKDERRQDNGDKKQLAHQKPERFTSLTDS